MYQKYNKPPTLKSSEEQKKPSRSYQYYCKPKRFKIEKPEIMPEPGQAIPRQYKTHGPNVFLNSNLWAKQGISSGCKGLKISQAQAAKENNVSKVTQKRSIREDVENGWLKKVSSIYICKKTKRRLCGKNEYYLTKKAVNYQKKRGYVEFLYLDELDGSRKDPTNPPPGIENGKKAKEIALAITISNNFLSHNEIPKNRKRFLMRKYKILKKWGILDSWHMYPDWFFDKVSIFHKALKLIHKKKLKGYKVKNFLAFIIHIMKEQCCGFRRYLARMLSKELLGDEEAKLRRALRVSKGGRGIEGLEELYKNFNLDVSEKALLILGRKGLAHLNQAVDVCIKKIKHYGIEKIKNVNAYLNWIVGFKNPYDIFKLKEKPLLTKEEYQKKIEATCLKKEEEKLKANREFNKAYDKKQKEKRELELKERRELRYRILQEASDRKAKLRTPFLTAETVM